jgi:hypothetical protein
MCENPSQGVCGTAVPLRLLKIIWTYILGNVFTAIIKIIAIVTVSILSITVYL